MASEQDHWRAISDLTLDLGFGVSCNEPFISVAYYDKQLNNSTEELMFLHPIPTRVDANMYSSLK